MAAPPPPRRAELLGGRRPGQPPALEDADLSVVAGHGRSRRVEDGTVLARAGSAVAEVLVVQHGEVELRGRAAPGHRPVAALARRGDAVADIPLLLGTVMPFDAVARREVALTAIARDDWLDLLATSPGLSLRWMTSIARRLDADRRRLLVITTRDLTAQVAFLLLEQQEVTPSGPLVRLPHATLAQLLGAQRPSVTAVLADLRRRGLVETAYGAVRLLDVDGLRAVAGPDPLR